MTIPWANVRVQPVVDCVGRRFKWTDLKGKRIYICGHGAHIYRDGYCTVPSGTTVNFFQTYGRFMLSKNTYEIINGTKDYAKERSFTSGQQCPNMTLFDDLGDDNGTSVLERTEAALKHRLGATLDQTDHFIFNCNQFSGLSVYKPLPPKPALDRETRKPLQTATLAPEMGHMLKLDEILAVLEGNTLEWVCCQEIFDRYRAPKNDAPQTKHAMNTDGLSDRVKAGLDAMIQVSAAIKTSHWGKPGLRNTGDLHDEGYWSTIANRDKYKIQLDKSGKDITPPNIDGKYMPNSVLNRARTGMNIQDVRQKAMASRLKINDGLSALDDEPQGNPFKTHQARAELQRGLLVVDNLLRNISGMK